MSYATRDSWKTLPAPAEREPLGFSSVYTAADAEKIREGLVPQAMEDKWFIYFLDGWLYFHRSWTGACIYAVRFEGSPAGVRAIDSWVSRDPEHYRGDDLEYDRKLVTFLIDAFLLGKTAQFPLPADAAQPRPGVYQHHLVGRVYPEVEHRKKNAYLAREQQCRALVSAFLSGQVCPSEFALQYMTLWKRDRDLQWDVVNRGMTLDSKEQSICGLLDDIFIACDSYSEEPKSEFDISESQFRAEVASLASKLWPDEKAPKQSSQPTRPTGG